MQNTSELKIELQDNEWKMQGIDHDRLIVRAIVIDDCANYYFVQVIRDDDFGKATLIQTAGGGVEENEELEFALKRELREELGVEVEILCKIGLVSDYYNRIKRHNINHYFLCKIKSFGNKHLTNAEAELFHLSTLTLTFDEAVAKYKKHSDSKLGRLIAQRELPILERAKNLLTDC